MLFKPQKVRKVGSGLQEATRGGELWSALDCRGLEQSVAVPRDSLSYHEQRQSHSPLTTVFRPCRLWGQQAVVVHLVALCGSSSPGLAAESCHLSAPAGNLREVTGREIGFRKLARLRRYLGWWCHAPGTFLLSRSQGRWIGH